MVNSYKLIKSTYQTYCKVWCKQLQIITNHCISVALPPATCTLSSFHVYFFVHSQRLKTFFTITAVIQEQSCPCSFFYSASALLAMRSAVLARGILSLSLCPSVTFRCFVQTNEDTIVRFSASGRTINLVSGKVKFIRIFEGDHPQRGR